MDAIGVGGICVVVAAFRVCAAAYGVGTAAVDVGVGGNCV